MKEVISYKEMMKELEKIMQTVSQRDLDLDTMVSHVERGYSLIGEMRERIQNTKKQIEVLQSRFHSDQNQEELPSQEGGENGDVVPPLANP